MFSKEIEEYIKAYSSKEDEILYKLQRETYLKVFYPRMISGPVQGKFLEMTSAMIQPENVLEVGTFTGYSTICFAKGLAENGLIDTIEINPELHEFASKYFKMAGFSDQIIQHIGNAVDIIPTLNKQWDLVFLDADKENYLNYYQLVFNNVKRGGFILVDNVLWDGKVLNPEKHNDKETTGIIEFNNFIRNDERVQNILLPLRDGIMILRKL